MFSRLITGWFPTCFTFSQLISLPRLFTGLVARLRRRWSRFLSPRPGSGGCGGWKRFSYGCWALRNLLLWELFSNALIISMMEQPVANKPIPFLRGPFPPCDAFRALWIVHCLDLRLRCHFHLRLDETVLRDVSYPYESFSWRHDRARHIFRSYEREAK